MDRSAVYIIRLSAMSMCRVIFTLIFDPYTNYLDTFIHMYIIINCYYCILYYYDSNFFLSKSLFSFHLNSYLFLHYTILFYTVLDKYNNNNNNMSYRVEIVDNTNE